MDASDTEQRRHRAMLQPMSRHSRSVPGEFDNCRGDMRSPWRPSGQTHGFRRSPANCKVHCRGAGGRRPRDRARRYQIVCVVLLKHACQALLVTRPSAKRRLNSSRLNPQFGRSRSHRLIVNSAISFECFRNMSIRLAVNSAMTLGNSKGDLIQASL
jgi:hypothetical protein